ncbi:MAG: NYN domain-containing protein, partial [Thermodesulfobacteriota bacterium]
IGLKKNRADLFISIDAFETLYVNNPGIDRYIFVTSDSDFTVVMDKLRKYGKEVWLACRKADETRQILAKSCDKMLFIEDFYQFEDEKSHKEYTEGNDNKAKELFKEVLKNIDSERLPFNISVINDRMKQLDRSFDVRHTSYKRFIDLVRSFQKQEIITLEESESGLVRITDIDLSKIEEGNSGSNLTNHLS